MLRYNCCDQMGKPETTTAAGDGGDPVGSERLARGQHAPVRGAYEGLQTTTLLPMGERFEVVPLGWWEVP